MFDVIPFAVVNIYDFAEISPLAVFGVAVAAILAGAILWGR